MLKKLILSFKHSCRTSKFIFLPFFLSFIFSFFLSILFPFFLSFFLLSVFASFFIVLSSKSLMALVQCQWQCFFFFILEKLFNLTIDGWFKAKTNQTSNEFLTSLHHVKVIIADSVLNFYNK